MTDKNLTELLAETKAIVEFGDNASLEIQVTYESDRIRYLAKNGVGLFICGAAAENERLLPLIDSLIEALERVMAECERSTDQAFVRHLNEKLADIILRKAGDK